MYKYVHDVANRIVYRYPVSPNIRETLDGRGKVKRRTGWSADMEISITRADNRLAIQWEKSIAEYPTQFFDAHYSRDQVIYYFLMHHAPDGNEIGEQEYSQLQQAYEAEARKRI